jgi:DHA3 family macrolide efflux protein-like MFS transporter
MLTPSFRAVLKNSPYRRLLIGQIVSILGDFLALFAIMDLLAFRLHAGPAAVTMVSFWALLPQAIFSPIAGGLVDRWDVRRTLVASDFARALLILPLLFFTDLNIIYVVFLGIGLGSSLFTPARSVMMKLIVSEEELLAANGLMQQAFLLSRALSFPVAGLLVGILGIKGCFWLDIASFVISGLTILSIPVARPQETPRNLANFGEDLREGLHFLVRSPALSGMTSALGIALLTGTAMTPLLALYVRDRMPANSMFYAILTGLVGAGAMAGIQCIPKLRRHFDDCQLVLWGLTVLAGSALLMALFQSVVPVTAGAFGIGFGIGLVLTPAQTLLQTRTPLSVLGRVSSSVLAVMSVGQLGGIAISGQFARSAGIQAVFLACALVSAGCALILKVVRSHSPADFQPQTGSSTSA